ncbi:hypothetical protein [Paludibaculum fermentans]|uniref:hypothetical protein n=1 Tax=Paludibaculum fermentans TaxID=1473598 RepID=UPI003EC105EF
MATDLAVRRYRTWYSTLLRLYPRPFQDRFGEAMSQTFHDQCRECRNTRQGLFRFALWVFFETSMGIVRENAMQMTELRKTILRVALVALGLLMVPLVASQIVEGWNWPPGAFVFTYVLFFGTGMAYALIARKMGAWAYKAGVGIALVSGFVMGWSTMVHISESENPANFVYFGVLAVGAIGVWLARLEARGMARATFAMAATLVVVAAFALMRSSVAPSSGPVWDVGVGHGGFVLLFAVSGLLFRRASLAEAK